MTNNFQNTDCVALYRCEDNEIVFDSIGNNTFQNVNGVSSNIISYKEGSSSAEFQESNSQYLSINDNNLDIGYPLRSSDVVKKFSITAWFQFFTLDTGTTAIYSKWDLSSARTIIPLRVSNFKWQSYIGYDGGDLTEKLYEGGAAQLGRWYHMGFSYDDTTKYWLLNIWDDIDYSLVVDVSGISTNNISVGTGKVFAGAGGQSNNNIFSHHDGLIDELAIFNNTISSQDIADIRNGVYGRGEIKLSPELILRTGDINLEKKSGSGNITVR